MTNVKYMIYRTTGIGNLRTECDLLQPGVKLVRNLTDQFDIYLDSVDFFDKSGVSINIYA